MKSDRGEFAYAPPDAKAGNVIQLSAEEAHHLFRVRRVRENDTVWVSDGMGMAYECRVQPDHSLTVAASHPHFAECRTAIHLCCAILKGESNRAVVDAAVQLGAAEILFFSAQRSEGRLAETALAKLFRTAISALKQSGRATLPSIKMYSDLAAALTVLPERSKIFVTHPSSTQVREASSVSAAITMPLALVVGPEGGLTEQELEIAQQHEGQLLHLAPARLRSETAVVAGLMYLLGVAGESHTFRG